MNLKSRYISLLDNQATLNSVEIFLSKQEATVFHEPGFNKIVSKYFKTKFIYIADKYSDFSCICPIHYKKRRLLFSQYYYKSLYDVPYGGFVGQDVTSEYLKPGLLDICVYAGFPQPGAEKSFEVKKFSTTNMIDLTLSEDDIFNNVIQSKRRNMIRKAEKNNITIQQFSSNKGLRVFWPMLKDLHSRLGYVLNNFNFYLDLLSIYGPINQAAVFIAYKDNQPLSGVFVIGNKTFMHYYKGASLPNTASMGQGELLQWEAIKWAKKQGVRYYDFCNLNKTALPHIAQFKLGFSNQVYQFESFSESGIGYKIGRKIGVL